MEHGEERSGGQKGAGQGNQQLTTDTCARARPQPSKQFSNIFQKLNSFRIFFSTLPLTLFLSQNATPNTDPDFFLGVS